MYRSPDEFVKAIDGAKVRLETLFNHSMLIDLDGAGVAMPYHWGFRDRLLAAPKHPNPAQKEMLQAILGGRADRDGLDSDSTKRVVSVESDSTNDPPVVESDSTNVLSFVESPNLTRTAAAYAKDSMILGSSSSNEGRAGDSTETGRPVESDSTDR